MSIPHQNNLIVEKGNVGPCKLATHEGTDN